MRLYTKPEKYYDPTREMQTPGKDRYAGNTIGPNLNYIMSAGEWVLF